MTSNEKKAWPCGEIAYELLVAAASDPDHAPEEATEHLRSCAACRAYAEGLASDLDNLTRMAARFTPAYTRPIRVPETRAKALRLSPRPAFALALAAALVLFFAAAWLFTPGTGENPGFRAPGPRAPFPAQVVEESLFAENALPPVYIEISGEEVEGFEEDFTDYGEGDADSELWSDMDPMPWLTRAVFEKGALLC